MVFVQRTAVSSTHTGGVCFSNLICWTWGASVRPRKMLSPTWQVFMAHVRQKRLHPGALHAVQTTRTHTYTHRPTNTHFSDIVCVYDINADRCCRCVCLHGSERLFQLEANVTAKQTHQTHTHTDTHTLSRHIAGGLLPVWVSSGWNCSLSTWCCPHYTDAVLTAIHLVCRVLKSLNGCQECSTQTYIWPALWTSVCVCVCVCVCNTPVGRTVAVCINGIKIDFTLFPPVFFHTHAFIFYPPPRSVIQVYFSSFCLFTSPPHFP